VVLFGNLVLVKAEREAHQPDDFVVRNRHVSISGRGGSHLRA
jgi:hypothetical protein